MKRFGIFLISLILLLIVVAVLVGPSQEIVSVSLVSETKETTTYSDSKSIQIFEDAIRTVKRIPGAVDVGPPTYRMTVTYADTKAVEYSLYMNFETKDGFLIKSSNSERMLDLRDKNAVELADLIHSSFAEN